MNTERIAELIHEILIELGEDPDRQGLVKTPERVAEAYRFLTSGYEMTVEDVVNEAVFDSESQNMIICRDIEIFSLCEHHMLPFFGRCHIGYIAQDKVLGLSKLARTVDVFSRRLQIQERLTAQIANAINEVTHAEGVGVVMECKHLCMMMRGVEKQNATMTTSSVLGSFLNDSTTRNEFHKLIQRPITGL